jgi:type IV pilus assembly protein PilA
LENEVIARYHKSMKDQDQGFTLIELLVVIVIIGILAAIAIPTFLNQRKKGVDASIKSDLTNAATTVETWVTDNPAAVVAGTVAGGVGTGALLGAKLSTGNTVTLVASSTAGAYCIFGYNSGASAAINATNQIEYISQAGGLQTAIAAATTCT